MENHCLPLSLFPGFAAHARAKRFLTVASLALALAPICARAADTYDTSPAVRAVLEKLRTEDSAEIKTRWGALGELAGKAFLAENIGSRNHKQFRNLQWVVPGAVLRYGTGYCTNGKCINSDYLAQFDPGEAKLAFFLENDRKFTGTVRADGAVELRGGLFASETVESLDGGTKLKIDQFIFERITPEQLTNASDGLLGPRLPGPWQQASKDGIQEAMDVTHQSAAELRRQWGLFLDLLNARFVTVDGRDVDWHAFEWVQPGTVLRWWTRGCGDFSCTEPYQITVFYVPGENRLTAMKSTGAKFSFRVNGQSLDRLNTCCTEDIWWLAPNGDLRTKHSTATRVSAEKLAEITKGASRVVMLAADTPKPAPNQDVPAAVVPVHVEAAVPLAKVPTAPFSDSARIAQAALIAKFPTIGVGPATQGQLLPAANGKQIQPVIYVLEESRPQHVAIKVSSSDFAPLIAVYAVGKSVPIAKAAHKSSANLSAALESDSVYLVVIQSVGNYPGKYTLTLEPQAR